jgi:hypothetical protein
MSDSNDIVDAESTETVDRTSTDFVDETAGIGAADPITGVTAGHDDLDDDAQLPDDDQDLDAAGESGEDVDYAAGDPEAIRAEGRTTVTNDALAGETVEPGPGDGNNGPTGGAPAEFEPELPHNELSGQDIDLDDEA